MSADEPHPNSCRHHPDLKGSQAANRFVKIQEAYEVVTGKRRGSTVEETQQPAKAGSWDFHDWYARSDVVLLKVLRCNERTAAHSAAFLSMTCSVCQVHTGVWMIYLCQREPMLCRLCKSTASGPSVPHE